MATPETKGIDFFLNLAYVAKGIILREGNA